MNSIGSAFRLIRLNPASRWWVIPLPLWSANCSFVILSKTYPVDCRAVLQERRNVFSELNPSRHRDLGVCRLEKKLIVIVMGTNLGGMGYVMDESIQTNAG